MPIIMIIVITACSLVGAGPVCVSGQRSAEGCLLPAEDQEHDHQEIMFFQMKFVVFGVGGETVRRGVICPWRGQGRGDDEAVALGTLVPCQALRGAASALGGAG